MKKIGIAELKANLSRNLRDVQRGNSMTVLDRSTPVALLIPYRPSGEPLVSRPPAGKRTLGAIPIPRPLDIDTDVVDLLLEERGRR